MDVMCSVATKGRLLWSKGFGREGIKTRHEEKIDGPSARRRLRNRTRQGLARAMTDVSYLTPRALGHNLTCEIRIGRGQNVLNAPPAVSSERLRGTSADDTI